jgi:hypothetical protein
MIDIPKLMHFLSELKPVRTIRPTIFNHGKFEYSENIISNFYRYFLESEESHGFKKLFLIALFEVLQSKTSTAKFELLHFESYKVSREFPTKNGGRIDLVIESKGIDNISRAIVIENKIYHSHDNDFDDYKEIDFDENIPILLTLDKCTIIPEGYINIRHIEWVESIEKGMNNLTSDVDPESLFLLNQFCTNIKKITMETTDSKYVEFFLKNAESFKSARDIFDKVDDFNKRSLDDAALRNGYNPSRAGEYTRYLQPKDTNNIYYKIDFKDLMYDKVFTISLCLMKSRRERLEVYEQRVRSLSVKSGLDKKKGQYAYLNEIPYLLDEHQILRFGEVVMAFIESDWKQLEMQL